MNIHKDDLKPGVLLIRNSIAYNALYGSTKLLVKKLANEQWEILTVYKNEITLTHSYPTQLILYKVLR